MFETLTGVREIHTSEALQQALGGPSTSSGVNTPRSSLDPVDKDWLASCVMWFMATSTGDTADCSIRGDRRGAIYIPDDAHLVLPERAGNRRGDGYANLLQRPCIGLLFLIPGRTDTVRVNGQATLINDAPWYDKLALDGVRPPLAIVVKVEEVFYHCVKAIQASGIWDPSTWQPDAAPSRQTVAAALRQEVTGALHQGSCNTRARIVHS